MADDEGIRAAVGNGRCSGVIMGAGVPGEGMKVVRIDTNLEGRAVA